MPRKHSIITEVFIHEKLKTMKSRIVLLFFLFGSLTLSAQKYSDPDSMTEKTWKEVVQLLQTEAAFFEGKKGRIRLRQSEYTDFKFNKLSVSENQLMSEKQRRENQ